MNSIQQKILQKLLYTPQMTYNALWDKNIRSNSFAYHIKSLEESNLIQKVEGAYSLTLKGKSLVTYMNGSSGEMTKQPLSVVILGAMDNDKILLMKRTKEPFRDLWGLPGGKIEFSQFLSQTAHDELFEETGLTGNISFKGLVHIHTYDTDSLAFSHLLHIARVDNIKGTMKKEDKEGELAWFSLSEISQLEHIPDLPLLVEIITSTAFTIHEVNRYMEDGVCKRFEIVR
ncbi:MAG: NUDIX domain-containing protein [Candidatus Woesearchaeota archaeon]